MAKKFTLLLLLFFLASSIYCQTNDSVKLSEVIISSYLTSRPLLRLPTSVHLIDQNELNKQSGQSLVPVMNALPGVRMEERSPGSYRLSIRGSLLRSPFGIRNVKVYLNEFPLTDAGGNTYLNLLDMNTLHSIEVLKGPDGSLFGANSGGVVRLNILSSDTITKIRAGIGTGSYGLFHEYATVKQKSKRNVFEIGEGWQRSDGYRENSKFDRKYIHLADQFQYRPKAYLRFLFFYSNLNYQTPGGLTLQQWTDNPRAARPPTPALPGAKEQKAAIYNSTFYGGGAHEIKLNPNWSHTATLFGSYTDFKNPFITNYENRTENTVGARTWIQASNNQEGSILVKFHAGAEAARTNANIKNYNNDKGQPSAIQKFDFLSINQLFIFNHLMFDFYNKWLLEGGLSLNFTRYSFYTTAPIETHKTQRSFEPQLMPKLAVSYQLASVVAVRASVSRGFSPPTLAEIRSSNNEINETLQPESGWNYETGLRIRSINNVVWWDVTAFYYALQNAIVRRVNEGGQEYFVNAGGTKQMGLESQLMVQLVANRAHGWIRGSNLNNSLTYSGFKFNNYTINSSNYSGNKLTGVPSSVVVSGWKTQFPFQMYLFIQHTYTSSIFLDDGNTVSSSAYHLLLLKASLKLFQSSRFGLEFSGGIDNALNEKYGLGHDLNAAGGRYFNAAMPRNYFCKLEMSW